MCEKRNSIRIFARRKSIRLDSCLRYIVDTLNNSDFPIKTLASCCGHGKYPMSIVVKDVWRTWELFSGVELKRKKRFYVKDSEGFYYIPEVIN